jgi:3'-5' exonuclease
MLSNLLLIDIETVPMEANFNNLTTNWQQLWLDKSARYHLENSNPNDTWRQRGGIVAEFGKIVCISTGYFYENENAQQAVKIKSIAHDNEVVLLNQFIDLCNKVYKHNKDFCFAGHNIKEFDVPYICRRILINNIELPQYLWFHDKKPWEIKMFDTLAWWRFGDNKNYTSLHLLANVLQIATSKDDIDGSMVQDVYYIEKNLPRIVSYCQKDVVVVANIILKFNGMPLLNKDCVVVVV